MAVVNGVDRFIDAGKEPTRILLPIEGYEKKPLVSLKDAVSTIDVPIHNLDSMVWTSERNCEDPPDGLTPDESAAIHLYTMENSEGHDSFYALLNRKLRAEKRNELKSWYSYLKLFFTALYKIPSSKKIIWRGIRGNVSHLYQKDFIWWGVSSCTDSMEVMETFIGRSELRTVFMIESINGKEIISHSFYKTENEIILMPGTYFRVMGKWSPAENLYMIHLQEETPPYQLVAPPFTPSASVGALPGNKITSTGNIKPKQQAQSHESKTTSQLPSPPRHKNPKLEQTIKKNIEQSELSLNYESLTDDDMEIVAYYLLQNNQELTELSLSNNEIGDKGAQYLGEELQKNTTLTTLHLHKNQIGDKGAQYLSEALQKNKTLTTLYLSENQIGDKGALCLGKALQINTTLTKLSLQNNKIGDEGAQYLGEAMQKNTTLTELDLYNNPFGDQGGKYLEKSRNKRTNLNLDW